MELHALTLAARSYALLSARVHLHDECKISNSVDVAVLCRNQRLFRIVYQSHHSLQSAVLLNFHKGQGSYVLRRFTSMSPALNSSVIRHFKHSTAIEIHNSHFISTQDCHIFIVYLSHFVWCVLLISLERKYCLSLSGGVS